MMSDFRASTFAIGPTVIVKAKKDRDPDLKVICVRELHD